MPTMPTMPTVPLSRRSATISVTRFAQAVWSVARPVVVPA
jgi:hypothetical protein